MKRVSVVGASVTLVMVGVLLGLSVPSIPAVLGSSSSNSSDVPPMVASVDGDYIAVEFRPDVEPDFVAVQYGTETVHAAWVHRGQDTIVIPATRQRSVELPSGHTMDEAFFVGDTNGDDPLLANGDYIVEAYRDGEEIAMTPIRVDRPGGES
ncbi:hypothetical protein [Halococcus sp. IIIV-5B]|uniref:hypothetical protein n=1 Tax=Halococcus sp. IIIV-5B TaxID=2321230 RepID=UPI000E70FD0B|nr:hypothetical protein [Halococcus sp. IIIV-5B]RJS96614.1 hypothetical protein D3261_18965 [Halococcus sp. IIIV-5B]